MKPSKPFAGTARYLATHWPTYLLLYGGAIVGLLLLGFAAERGLNAVLLPALLLFVACFYFVLASLWAAHRLYDADGLQTHHRLFDMGQIRDTTRLAFIDLDGHHLALELGSRLASGQLVVVDVYHPQLTPARALARGRARAAPPPPDPRFVWRDGSISLLPLPDESVFAVVLHEVLWAFVQQGDRLALLREVQRVLAPNGRLLLAECVRTRHSWLLWGPAAAALPTPAQLQELAQAAGFTIQRAETHEGLITCLRADKPVPRQGQQLQLNLKL